jgi:hypothetical protein
VGQVAAAEHGLPELQLGLGAVGGGVGNFADSYQQGKRGWALVGDTLVGAATGALGNAGVGDKLGAEVGFASSFSNISNNFSPTKDATVGNSVGVALSTYMGAGCGDIDHQDNANC